MIARALCAWPIGIVGSLVACGASSDAASSGASLDSADLPYASELVSFEPGDGAGHGMDGLPDVVLGPPLGGGTGKGSLDVLSLGLGGEIVLGFGGRTIIDAQGADFVVFENAFWASGDPTMPFSEPAEVAVSEDGETWHTFACDPKERGGGTRHSGCAGIEPTLAYDALEMPQLNPEDTGGDAFDLAVLNVPSAAFVRIRDLSDDEAEGTNVGFDLDAIGLVHYAEP